MTRATRITPDHGSERPILDDYRRADQQHVKVMRSACRPIIDLLKEDAATLQVLAFFLSSFGLQARVETMQHSFVKASSRHIAAATGLSVNSVERSVKKLRELNWLQRGTRHKGCFSHAIPESLVNDLSVPPAKRERIEGRYIQYLMVKGKCSRLIMDALIKKGDPAGALPVLFYFIRETLLAGRIGSPNWIEATREKLSAKLHREPETIRSGFNALLEAGVLIKRKEIHSYRLSNYFVQSGRINLDRPALSREAALDPALRTRLLRQQKAMADEGIHASI